MADAVVTRAHRMAAELAYTGKTRDEMEAELREHLEPEELGEMEKWRDTGELEDDHDPEVGDMLNRIAAAIAAEGMREREACVKHAHACAHEALRLGLELCGRSNASEASISRYRFVQSALEEFGAALQLGEHVKEKANG